MWLLVVNRKAGKERAPKLVSAFEIFLNNHGEAYEIVDEDSAAKTINKTGALVASGKITRLIAFGGDGLVHLCVQLLVDTNIAFGVAAAGTGNDFARTLAVQNMSIGELYSLYSQPSDHLIDLVKINTPDKVTYFVQVLSTGFDANVNALANRIKWPKGKLKYSISMLMILNQFKPIKYSITIDDVILHKEAMLISVANGNCYGGGMKIQPTALNNDGILDVLMVSPVSKLKLLLLFPRIFSGTHINHPKVSISRGKRVSLTANTECFADGEYISSLPIEVTVLDKTLHTWISK